jgi:glycosyltransferase involved in cell wall biosynthesis
LLDRGLEVEVLTGTPLIEERSESDLLANWYDVEPGQWLPLSTLDGVPLHRIRLPDTKGTLRTKLYYDALLNACSKPRESNLVVQLLTNIRPQAAPWLRDLKASGAAVLYSVSQYPKWPKKPIKRLLRLPGYRKVYNEFDALVTNSSSIKEFLEEIGVQTRVEYIPNGVNLERFHPANSDQERENSASIRRQLGIAADHKIVVVVGAIMPRKAPEKVVAAWQRVLTQFPDTHLLFVGPRSDIHDPKLKPFGLKLAKLIANSGARKKVHFTGNIDNVQDYLRASDIFILASDREGTPNSVLEAMATGLPCLVTPYIGISSSIGKANEHYQLVEPDAEGIASKLLALLQNVDFRSQLAASGLAFVTRHMDQRQTLDQYAELYREVGERAACGRRRSTKD